jgi:retinol dehydrogenase 12
VRVDEADLTIGSAWPIASSDVAGGATYGPPMQGNVVVITGANIGIGREVARALHARGAQLRLLVRSLDKVAPLLAELPGAVAIACDLGNLASVRTAAEALLARDEPLHVLVNNAGVGGQRGVTSDGLELHFGVNHLGHFLLTNLLLERIIASKARIVHVASGSHYKATAIDWAALERPTGSLTGMPEYAVSKLCNVLFSNALARRLDGTGVTSVALNPGRVATNIWQRMPWPIRPLFKLTMLSSADGAYSTIRAATDLPCNGCYIDAEANVRTPNPLALDVALADELWRRSDQLVAVRRMGGRDVSSSSTTNLAPGLADSTQTRPPIASI